MVSDEEYQLLGLTQLQAKVISTLLELGGEATAPEIIQTLSNHQKVNRTSIYSVLSKLEQMDLLVSKDGTPSTYALISTNPRQLLSELSKPQEIVKENFMNELIAAKSRQSKPVEYELYYLKNKEKIRNQLKIVIEEADDYLLIMATANMLEILKEDLLKKIHEEETAILILPTWNPGNTVDADKIIQEYRNLLSSNQVADPLPIFGRIVTIMQSMTEDISPELLQITESTHFIQALTRDEMIMATYLDNGHNLGSGFYSREPMISQMMHIIYLSLFEQLNKLPEEITNEILRVKLEQSMKKLHEFVL